MSHLKNFEVVLRFFDQVLDSKVHPLLVPAPQTNTASEQPDQHSWEKRGNKTLKQPTPPPKPVSMLRKQTDTPLVNNTAFQKRLQETCVNRSAPPPPPPPQLLLLCCSFPFCWSLSLPQRRLLCWKRDQELTWIPGVTVLGSSTVFKQKHTKKSRKLTRRTGPGGSTDSASSTSHWPPADEGINYLNTNLPPIISGFCQSEQTEACWASPNNSVLFIFIQTHFHEKRVFTGKFRGHQKTDLIPLLVFWFHMAAALFQKPKIR